MADQPATEVPAATGQQIPQIQVQMRDEKMVTIFSNHARLAATNEELFVEMGIITQHAEQPNTAVMEVSTRVVMSFYAAKRLALMLSQAVQRHEQVFGQIQLDPRARTGR
ncbi:MAG TPA: DUF3467 domain-containing protein [Phycisphaerae bacterium]|nr:DUF3467 domain-containing protein [Phycisphaerae bacterium]